LGIKHKSGSKQDKAIGKALHETPHTEQEKNEQEIKSQVVPY
jgi:hypothetical protein